MNATSDEALLENWERLNQELMKDTMTVERMQKLIVTGVRIGARPNFLARLHARFNRLRAAEERRAIAAGRLPTWLAAR